MDAEPSPVEKDPNFTNSGADSASPEPHEGMEFGPGLLRSLRPLPPRQLRHLPPHRLLEGGDPRGLQGDAHGQEDRAGEVGRLEVREGAQPRPRPAEEGRGHGGGPQGGGGFGGKVQFFLGLLRRGRGRGPRAIRRDGVRLGGGREIVLRQLREADRVPLPDQLLGPGSAPRVVTRIGCKTMIVVKKLGSGKRVVSRFEREHNHALVSKNVMLRLGYLRGRDKSRFKRRGGMLRLGYFSRIFDCFVQQVVLRSNQMCTREEGAVSEEIYDVAMSALKSPWMVWFQMAFQSITMLFKPSGWPDRGGRAAGVPYQPHFAVRLSRGIGSLGLCCLLHNLLVADLLRQRNDQLREVANDDRSSHHDDDREEVEEEEYEEEDECFDDLCEGLRKMSITARRSGFRSPRECTLDSSTATTTRRKSSRGRRLS